MATLFHEAFGSGANLSVKTPDTGIAWADGFGRHANILITGGYGYTDYSGGSVDGAATGTFTEDTLADLDITVVFRWEGAAGAGTTTDLQWYVYNPAQTRYLAFSYGVDSGIAGADRFTCSWNGGSHVVNAPGLAVDTSHTVYITVRSGVVEWYLNGVLKHTQSPTLPISIDQVYLNTSVGNSPTYGYRVYDALVESITTDTEASIAATESGDVASIATGAMIAAIESGDAASLATIVTTGAAIAAVDSGDTAALTTTITTGATIAGIESGDVSAITTTVTTGATIAAVDGADIAFVLTDPVILAVESSDTAAITTTVTTGVSLAAIDSSDVTAINALSNLARIVATESGDVAAVTVSYAPVGNIILPALDVTVVMLEGETITGQPRLSRITAQGFMGGRGAGVLPALTAAGVLTCPLTLSGAVVLPALTTEGSLDKGGTIRSAVRLPRLLGASHTGIQGGGALQAIVVAGVVTAQETMQGTVVLPRIRSTGELSVYGYAVTGSVVLPAMIAGNRIVGTVLLPGMTAHAVVTDTAGVFEGWAYNVRTGATTRMTNLPFVQLLQVPGEAPLGIGSDGNVYQLTGDTDNGAVIPWEFETGLSDMGKPGMKRIPYVYMDGIIAGQVELTVLTDIPANEYKYNYTADVEAEHKPHRRKLGNRIRTRNLGFRMASEAGVYVEIDGIEPEIDVTQRSE